MRSVPDGRYNRTLPELRKDPVTGRWVIIATDRARRPSDFQRESVVPAGTAYCPFCAGHEHKTPPEILAYRDSGGPNEPGWRVRVVPNKFPALGIEGELSRQGEGMFDKMTGVGAHEVVIETPDHNLSLSQMSERQVEDVFWAFRERILDLKKTGASATSCCSKIMASPRAHRSSTRTASSSRYPSFPNA